MPRRSIRTGVGGEVLYTDSTHLKAIANKQRLVRQEVTQSTQSYLTALDAAIVSSREKSPNAAVKLTRGEGGQEDQHDGSG